MATLKSTPVKVNIRADSRTPPAAPSRTAFDVVFSRVIKVPKEPGTTTVVAAEDNFTTFSITDTLRFELDTKFEGTATLPDVEVPSKIRFSFLGADGRA